MHAPIGTLMFHNRADTQGRQDGLLGSAEKSIFIF